MNPFENPIKPIFAIPIYEKTFSHNELFLVQDEIKRILPKILESDVFENPVGWNDGVRTNIKFRHNTIKDFGLKNLEKLINDHVQKYLDHIAAWNPVPVSICHSWINITGKGEFQDWHTHQDACISGTYYYQSNGNDGNLEFDHPSHFVQAELFPIGYACERYFRVRPCVGKLVLFPGWMMHGVAENITETERISISFNLHRDHFSRLNVKEQLNNHS